MAVVPACAPGKDSTAARCKKYHSVVQSNVKKLACVVPGFFELLTNEI